VRANGKGTKRDAFPQQLSLLLEVPRSKPKPRRALADRLERPGILALDQRMTTAEVLRVVGVNRSTLFRWVEKGRFPRKHVSGGWLRSDIELWLAEKTRPDSTADCQAVPPARYPFAGYT
jgi:predicted DNA-binding transcriptional regulator AlpA